MDLRRPRRTNTEQNHARPLIIRQNTTVVPNEKSAAKVPAAAVDGM